MYILGTVLKCIVGTVSMHKSYNLYARYHFSRSQVVESLQQLNARRLAAAGRADERDFLSGREREVERLEHADLLSRRVAELGVLEADVAVDALLNKL